MDKFIIKRKHDIEPNSDEAGTSKIENNADAENTSPTEMCNLLIIPTKMRKINKLYSNEYLS